MKKISKEKLTKILHHAGSAHGDYEINILNGVYDDDWPAWYAAYIVGALGTEAIKPAKLTRLLMAADDAHKKQNRNIDWTTFYAGYIIDNLG
ncbi:hypothetical protein COV42_00865 [Candidatus Campbellbacteria bacterium CG11_big_fil_rev_8_21_14_0_20_44_21]|uniref:Uncharacterized protein n=1 Tax=Candidatus Campbellbacteria bacterium CG22_combo_CG10-13_8_21_14_all_43_18 TaxID=1974530 RepID=A0A2H0DXN0_9BACT|nr:MAG: hypothetical protein COW82_01905 [Candidatus Campbellbacteria bacterium CG22_combo_CG10-13_8_21_14_all_43_18]PIR24402.1 MAG: hypothetical protein COV42_00865 [Candidatus Campbellbacteria bacterium CG11_big_fil_rev_8_21_14_0_20_44_21]